MSHRFRSPIVDRSSRNSRMQKHGWPMPRPPKAGNMMSSVVSFSLMNFLSLTRAKLVDGFLQSLAPGGKVIFVDYHKPIPLHPAKSIMNFVFFLLEPFAKCLWQREIVDFAADARSFRWRKQTRFGDLFQVVVAENRLPSNATGVTA